MDTRSCNSSNRAATGLVCLCLCFLAAFSISPVLAEDVRAGDKPIVRNIKIEVREIFDRPDQKGFYKGVNSIKISTKDEVIRRELLLKEGDEYDEFRLSESIRILRAKRYLRRVTITPTFDGKFVDLFVQAQDTWTLIPQFSYAVGDGRNRYSVGMAESNIAGYGKRAEFLYEVDDQRTSYGGIYHDDRLFGSTYKLFSAYFDRSDGSEFIGSFGRPFRSLLDESGWAANIGNSDLVGKLYEYGDERYIFGEKTTDLGSSYTIALGDPRVQRKRLSFGYHYSASAFTQADAEDYDAVNLDPAEVSNDLADLPENRRFSGPTVAFQSIQPDYVSENYIDRFDRLEDYNLGLTYGGAIQIAPQAFGSRENALLFSALGTHGWRYGPGSFMRGELSYGGRYHDHGGFQNSILHGELKFYHVFGPVYVKDTYLGKHTFAAELTSDYAYQLDGDKQILIGGDNAVRGYKARAFEGDKRLVFNIEERVHIAEDVADLLSFGAAAFLDVAGVTNDAYGTIFTNNIYSDVGVGLRMAFPRSSGGRVLRLDLAFPLRDGPDGSGQFEPRLILSGGLLWGAGLQSEKSTEDDTTVNVGFGR